MSPGNAEKPALEQQPSTAGPIEMPKFWRNPAPPDPSVRRAPVSVRPAALPKETPKRIEVKAEPLRSPLAPVQELTKRRMLIQEERGEDKKATALKSTSVTPPASVVAWPDGTPRSNAAAPSKPIVISPPPRSESTSPSQGRTTPGVQAIETGPRSSEAPSINTQRKRPGLWKRAGKVVAWLGRIERGIASAFVELARSCRSATVRGLLELDRRAKNIYDARALAKRLRVATQFVRKIDPVSDMHAGAESQPRVRPESTTVTEAKSVGASLLFHTHRGIDALTGFARSLHGRKIRIRIVAGVPPLRIIRAASRIRALAVASLRKNNRVLTPLLMAALSAVLAMGMIGAVGRYASRDRATLANVTPLPAKNSAPAIFAASPSLSKPSAAVARAVSVQATLRVPKKEKTGVKKPVIASATPQKQIRRRPHHNSDEDYVAKDTYVYYGKP